MGTDSFICQIPSGGVETVCACRWHKRFTRGVVYKEGQWGQLTELQIDTVALQRWILKEENNQEACKGERRSNNSRLLQRVEGRWEVDRTDKANAKKKPILEYEEWAAIDRAVGSERRTNQAYGEQEKEGEASRWGTWKEIGSWN